MSASIALTQFNTSNVQPRFSKSLICKRRLRSNAANTSARSTTRESRTISIFPCFGISEKRISEPPQPARRAVGPSGRRFRTTAGVKKNFGVTIKLTTVSAASYSITNRFGFFALSIRLIAVSSAPSGIRPKPARSFFSLTRNSRRKKRKRNRRPACYSRIFATTAPRNRGNTRFRKPKFR